jgi:hypothetical protein
MTGAKRKMVSPVHGEFVGVMNKQLLTTVDTFLTMKRTVIAVRCATGSLSGFRVFKDI